MSLLAKVRKNLIILVGIILVGIGATILGATRVLTGQQVLTVYMAIISFVAGEKVGERIT